MSVIDEFDEISKKYDEQRRLIVPAYDQFYGLAIDMIDFPKSNPKVLDLGAGTGLFSKFILDKFENADLTLLDLSEPMLEVATQRFEEYKSKNYDFNIQFIVDDYISHDFENESFDIIISSLSIHHISEEDKETVYKKYINLLNDGGFFINADHVKSSSENIETKFLKIADDFILNNLSKEEYEKTRDRRAYDLPSNSDIQLKWMSDFGLIDVDIIFKYANYAVLFGKK